MDAMSVRSLSLLSFAILGCGGGGDPMVMPDAPEDYTLGEHPQLAMACSDTLADVYSLPTDLPAMDDSHRGDVFRCAKAEKLMVPEIKAQIEGYNENKFNTTYQNTAPGTIKSGFYSYRFAYRTTRATNANGRPEGDTAAILLIPAKPLEGAPVVIYGHGSTGFAAKCAPSKLDLSAQVQDQDYPPVLYRLAGYGYTVIAPDYAGFDYGQPPGYFNAEDEAHAILDATRAAAKILPSAPSKFAFVGHSQGGHAVLSAHSYAKAYGMQGELVGVATLAPYWFSMSAFAAVTADIAGYTTAKDVNTILYAMTYAYSAAEMREPGTGLDVFQDDKRDGAKEIINGGECYEAAKLQALGAKPSEFFKPAYAQQVGYSCAADGFSMSCPAGDPGEPSYDPAVDPAIWKSRWTEDRPPIDPQGPPILAAFGGIDTFITPGFAQCARDRFAKDLMGGGTTNVEYCFNNVAQHRDIMRGPDMDYLNQWIAAKAGVGPAPSACPAFPTGKICQNPPNDW